MRKSVYAICKNFQAILLSYITEFMWQLLRLKKQRKEKGDVFFLYVLKLWRHSQGIQNTGYL